jgi:hypothetical protein
MMKMMAPFVGNVFRHQLELVFARLKELLESSR